MPILSNAWNAPDYEQDAPLPPETVPAFQGWYRQLGTAFLTQHRKSEPSGRLVITSAYRPPDANKAAGGASHSQHEAIGGCCAVDFALYNSVGVRITDLKPFFDWIRQESYLPVDEVILEHVMVQRPIDRVWVPTGHDIIHVSYVVGIPRRIAKEGESNNLVPYTSWPFNTAPPDAIDHATNE